MLPSHPIPPMFETDDEKLVREEGERLVDMYAPGSEPYLRGKAMLRIVRLASNCHATNAWECDCGWQNEINPPKCAGCGQLRR